MGIRQAIAQKRTPQTYEEQTHGSPWRIVRHAHQRRFEVAIDVILEGAPSVVVDYGTGDGHLLDELLQRPMASPPTLIAYEPVPEMLELLRARFGDQGRVRVCPTLEAVTEELAGAKIDTLACLGVLEHLPERHRATFYDFARTHLAPTGSLVVGVPVEIGPAVCIKELGRRGLKGRPAEYSLKDLALRTVGRTTRDPDRFEPRPDLEFLPLHRGFDHRHVVEELEPSFRITDRRRSPVAWAPAWLCNQELLLRAEPRHRAGSDRLGPPG